MKGSIDQVLEEVRGSKGANGKPKAEDGNESEEEGSDDAEDESSDDAEDEAASEDGQ